MEQHGQSCDEIVLDIREYINVVVKRKITFISVFLLIFALGVTSILFSPKLYNITMMIQPPVVGESLTGASDLESAESLKGMIINGAFDEQLKKKMDIDLNTGSLGFQVVIPEKTNILRVSVIQGSKTREFGIVLLQNLYDSISTVYAKRIAIKNSDIDNQIIQKELAISNVKEKIDNFQAQIKEIFDREDKLMDEVKKTNINTTQILDKREKTMKDSTPVESIPNLLLTNLLQNNLSYLNQLNNQFSELSIRRSNLDLEIKDTESQIKSIQIDIDKLKENKLFVSNLKLIAQPRVSPTPIGPSKKKTLAISIVMGLFIGLLAVSLQEFWLNNLVKK